jgi:hypothetical protein
VRHDIDPIAEAKICATRTCEWCSEPARYLGWARELYEDHGSRTPHCYSIKLCSACAELFSDGTLDG